MSDQDPERSAFHWELLKLLLQVARADDVVQPSERLAILNLALRVKLSDERIAELERHLDGDAGSLPVPNFALLRTRREEAMDMASQLVLADGEIHEAENEFLQELHMLLYQDRDDHDGTH